MPSPEPVDVLIIGAGAAGAAMAWRLSDTRMRILCLEQGDWMDPARYPSASLDWESQGLGPFSLSPNSRSRVEDYPINDAASPIKISNFNAVGGSTILYAAHFPRLHPSDFRVDLVSEGERRRNKKIDQIQGTRNAFIDDPALADTLGF